MPTPHLLRKPAATALETGISADIGELKPIKDKDKDKYKHKPFITH